MQLSRRNILAGAGALAAAGVANAQQPAPSPSSPPANIESRVLERLLQNVRPMSFDGRTFSGAGWEMLVSEGSGSEMVMLGEEHGLHETPLLARAWFEVLRAAEFDTLAIEISPPIAQDLDRAARGGVEGIGQYCASHPPGPAFYFWRTEAELIAAARAAVPGRRDVLWGLDYEVTGDRRLIERLRAKAPRSAHAALDALDNASQQGWASWRETHNPRDFFAFSADPELVRAVRAAWPRRDDDASEILTTLEETLEINRLFPGQVWASNERRARNMRRNLVAHLSRAEQDGQRPRILFKMGENHLQRGVNWTGNFDIGSLAAEVAALRGGKSFSVLVGGGAGGHHGVLNPTVMTTVDAPVGMFDEIGFRFLTSQLAHEGPALVDMRPARALLSGSRLRDFNNPEAVRNIFSYDALVIWNGSTATQFLAP